ncbi:hypothetical protein C1I97_18860 [Streptomyces sp. NTH33]|nr:hypothetical protein C1I97_18860 [Streptomyces sp. NTH33]
MRADASKVTVPPAELPAVGHLVPRDARGGQRLGEAGPSVLVCVLHADGRSHRVVVAEPFQLC